MKYFIYKLFAVSALMFIVYHATIGYTIKNLKIELANSFDKDKIEYLRNKIRNEIKSSLNKEKILNPDDAELIEKFIKKISSEINNNK